jgi:hypothetical protein
MSFTLYLNSGNGTAVNAGSTQAIAYNFNWSVLEENASYELSFAFSSKAAGALTSDSQFVIRLNGIGSLNNTYNVTSAGVATSTEIIGMIRPQDVASGGGGGHTHFLNAGTESNPALYLKRKPVGNNFRVEILNLNGSNGVVLTAEWTLILYFKKL